MPEYTPNLNLYLPGGGGSGTIPDEIADIDKLNENFRLIDASLGGAIVPAVAGYTPKFNGELAYARNTKSLFINDGGVTPVRGTPSAASVVDRDLIFPAPAQGDSVFRTDKGWVETYYVAYHATTNVGGATPAGWYPTSAAIAIALYWGSGFTITTTSSPAGGSPSEVTNIGGFTRTGSQITVPFSGIYRIGAGFVTGTAGSAQVSLEIKKTTGARLGWASANQTSSDNRNTCVVTTLGAFTAGETVAPYLFGSTNLALGGVHNFFVEYLGPKVVE